MKLAISQNSKIFARNYFRVFLGKLQRVAAVIFQSYLKKQKNIREEAVVRKFHKKTLVLESLFKCIATVFNPIKNRLP